VKVRATKPIIGDATTGHGGRIDVQKLPRTAHARCAWVRASGRSTQFGAV
jgi:hypothetical protein